MVRVTIIANDAQMPGSNRTSLHFAELVLFFLSFPKLSAALEENSEELEKPNSANRHCTYK
jgi:hypothetical protein